MNITDIDDKIIKRANEDKVEFREISSFYEKDYFDDMKALNVETPDVITRVSEFVPEIINYIKKLESNGYAYRSNGSVYFDIEKYNAQKNHSYPKLRPDKSSKEDLEKLLKEGEGVLN